MQYNVYILNAKITVQIKIVIIKQPSSFPLLHQKYFEYIIFRVVDVSQTKTDQPGSQNKQFFPEKQYNQFIMELESQANSLNESLSGQQLFKRHWSFHLLIVLSILQVTGHLINAYHLILLKPLPIIILLLLTERKTRQEKAFFFGLLFSLGGDLCLMWKNILVFQIGTALFLIAHLLYIRAFMHDISWKRLTKLQRKRHLILIAFAAFIMTLLMFNLNELWDKTPNLLLFLTYGLVLSAMAITASLRQNTDASYLLILIGAMMFGISDNSLAYFKFNKIHTDAGAAFVMTTYYIAQCLLSQGIRIRNSALK